MRSTVTADPFVRFMRALLTLVALFVLALGMLLAPVVRAATITVPCDTQALSAAIDAANATAEADTLSLASGCTYTLTGKQLTVTSTITIDGNGATLDANRQSRVIYNSSAGDLTLNEISIVNGSADYGSGIRNEGTLSLNRSTVSGNVATAAGGGLYIDGPLTLRGSTINDNQAGNEGGGLLIVAQPGDVLIENSTVSGNTAYRGGGIKGSDGNDVNAEYWITLRNVTITANHATDYGGGLYAANTYGVFGAELINSIVAGNTADHGNPDIDGDYAGNGRVRSGGYNLIGTYQGTGSGYEILWNDTDQVGTPTSPIDPLLGPLADNGGPTMTHALLPDSPAIDAGSCTVDADQRGVARPQDGNSDGVAQCDIGAFELEPTPLFAWSGFFEPVSNDGVNVVKAGRAVPLKFSLGGDQGLDIFASGYPKSQPVACAAGASTGLLDATVTAGKSGLRYDAATDTYTYVWKTDKKWTGCRELVVQLSDGSEHTARFQFK